MAKEIGIDLGSSSIVVSVVGDGIISREPSVIALDRTSGRLLDIGTSAEMYAKNNYDTTMLYRPLREGLIAQCEVTQHLISETLRNCAPHNRSPQIMLSIPCGLTDDEEGALIEIAARAGVRDCSLVYTPIASLVGAGLMGQGAMIVVDIGASFTNIMVIADGEIISMSTLQAAGNHFDDAIVRYVENEHGIRMSRRTAENVKKRIGTVWFADDNKYIDVKGKSTIGDAVRVVRISAREMFTALEEPTAAILEALCVTISRIPSEYIGSAFSKGIYLCGGGSLLDGFDRMISGVTGVNSAVIENPIGSAALGISKILGSLTETKKSIHANLSRMYIKNFR